MTLVVDASVALKWYVPEADAELASAVFRSDDLISPELVVAEVCNACWRLVRTGEVSPAQHGRVARAIGRAFRQLVPLVDLAPRAADLSLALHHPVYDCFYLALAEARGDRLITADRKFVTRVGQSPFAGHVLHLGDFWGQDS